MFSLIRAWTNGWSNNRDAGDLRRHRDHYDVTVLRLAQVMVWRCINTWAYWPSWRRLVQSRPRGRLISNVYTTNSSGTLLSTVRCRYNAVNFITNIHKRHPMARPLGRGMGCLLWIQHLIDIMSQFLQLLMQNLTILDRVITALDCIVYVMYMHQKIIKNIQYDSKLAVNVIGNYQLQVLYSPTVWCSTHWGSVIPY